MAHAHQSAHGHDGPHHHMGCDPRAQRWKIVPADLSLEQRQADLPVDVVERRGLRCHRPLGHGLLTNEPPQPPWGPPPAQHVPVRRVTALVSCRILESGSSRQAARGAPARAWAGCLCGRGDGLRSPLCTQRLWEPFRSSLRDGKSRGRPRGAIMPLISMADTGAEAAIGHGPSANDWQDISAEGGEGA